MQRSPAIKGRHAGVGAAGELGPVLTPLVPVPIRVHQRSAFSRYLASMHRRRAPLFASLQRDSGVDSDSRSNDAAALSLRRKGSKGWIAEIAHNCDFMTRLLLLFIGMVVAVEAYKLVAHYTEGGGNVSGGLRHGSAGVAGGSSAPSSLQRSRVTKTRRPGSEHVSLDSPGLFTRVQRAQSAVEGDASPGEVGAGGVEHDSQMRVVIDDIIAAARSERRDAAEAKARARKEREEREERAEKSKHDEQGSGEPEDALLDLGLFRPRENGVVAASARVVEGAEGEDAPMSSRVTVPVHDCHVFTHTRDVEFARFPFFARARGLDATGAAKTNMKTQAKTTMKERTIGIVTQTSIDRLELLAGMAERWRGPISCSVLLRAPRAARSSTTSSSSGSAPGAEAAHGGGGGGESIARQKKRVRHFWDTNPAVHTFVDIHLLVADADVDTDTAHEKAGGGSFRFPVNHLRNFALHHSRADFVLILDIDFVTSRKALPAINAQLATLGYPTNIVFVLPAFEDNADVISISAASSFSDEGGAHDADDENDAAHTDVDGDSAGDDSAGEAEDGEEGSSRGNRTRSAASALRSRRGLAFDEGEEAFRALMRAGASDVGDATLLDPTPLWSLPSDMRSARAMWDSQPPLLLPFHGRGYKRGHSFSNYSRWFEAHRGFGIPYNEGMEPYVVVARATVPYFQEVFWGYGLNKVSWHAELHCANYRYYTMPRVFVVHRPHSSKGLQQRSALQCNRERYNGPFKSYLARQVCLDVQLPAAACICGSLQHATHRPPPTLDFAFVFFLPQYKYFCWSTSM